MFAMADQVAVPKWLNFFEGTNVGIPEFKKMEFPCATPENLAGSKYK